MSWYLKTPSFLWAISEAHCDVNNKQFTLIADACASNVANAGVLRVAGQPIYPTFQIQIQWCRWRVQHCQIKSESAALPKLVQK